MKINQILESRDMCTVCGQTPCNCTHIMESIGSVGDTIRALYQQIYDQGDDALEYLNTQAPLFAQYWDQYEGDIESIIAELSPKNLIRIAQELKQVAGAEGLMEFAPGNGDDREPNEEEILRRLAAQWWSGSEQQMARAQQTLEAMGWEIGPDESGDDDAGVYVYRIGDDDGRDTIAFGHSELSLDEGVTEAGFTKTPSGDYINQHTGVRSSKPPVKKKRGEKTGAEWDAIEKAKKDKEQGVAEDTDERKQNALWAQITAHEKAAKKSKDLKQQHHLKMADQLRSQLKTSDNEQGVAEAPGAETLAHNQSTVASNEKAFDLEEGKPKEKEADYGADYQDMVARVKKLAGLGPLKTVYDPNKRVYRNMPTAVQPKK